MADVLTFPTPSSRAGQSDHTEMIVELEHEILDLRMVIADQSLVIRRNTRTYRATRLSAAVLIAFTLGWALSTVYPDSTSALASASAASPS